MVYTLRYVPQIGELSRELEGEQKVAMDRQNELVAECVFFLFVPAANPIFFLS